MTLYYPKQTLMDAKYADVSSDSEGKRNPLLLLRQIAGMEAMKSAQAGQKRRSFGKVQK